MKNYYFQHSTFNNRLIHINRERHLRLYMEVNTKTLRIKYKAEFIYTPELTKVNKQYKKVLRSQLMEVIQSVSMPVAKRLQLKLFPAKQLEIETVPELAEGEMPRPATSF